ncbi:MAG: aspartate-semialdehyde dehydrogenase [Solirubrobacteraceae bacterium]
MTRLAVVGASGAVGTTMLGLLRERKFPAEEIVAFASERSAGREIEGLTVRALTTVQDIDGFDLALFSAGSGVSREWAPRFAQRGTVVVDNSSYWRMKPDVPLVVAEVNPEAIARHQGIIANPNCSAMQALVVLKPIHDAAGLERIVFSSYQSVSGTGARAVEELKDQAEAILHEIEPPAPEVYPHRIAFNVLPQVETFKDGDDYTTEERKVIAESRKILGLPELRITATCARVPVINCHSEALNVQTRDELSPEDCRQLLARAPGVLVVDDPAAGRYPLASEASGRDEVLVGRIRRDDSNPRTLHLWVVGDNLRKGAATNAIQIAELLLARGLTPRRAGSPVRRGVAAPR